MRKAGLLLAILILGLLGAMAVTPLLEQAPPLRAANRPDQFDAVRAKARLAQILGDERPHPADSAADDEVRARLVATLAGMGLRPIVRDQLACNALFKQRGVSCARVRNVIAVLGPTSGKALLLNAHYDSVTVGPGASDDGMGVATLLEVAAILRHRPLGRPVILLFNEGEELGLVGARAFLADPLSHDVDSLINLEARGVEGPVNMFETSRPNAAPVELFAQAVANPVANSLSTDVYRLMPNYTDVNSFSERGWMTLNLAPIGNETRYHSPGDDVAALNPATLQHMGDQTLALAQSLARGTPAPKDATRIFLDLDGRGLVTMPLALGVVLLAGLLLAFGGLVRARGGALRGSGVVVGAALGSTALAWLALAAISAFRPGMFWRAHPLWTLLATDSGVLLVGTALLASVGPALSVRQLRAFMWLLVLCVGAIIGLFAPGGIVFFIVPPLVLLVGVALGRSWRPAEAVGSAAAMLCLYFSWGAMLGLLQELLNSGPMWLFAPLASLLLLPPLIEAKPLIDAAKLRAAVAPAALITAAGWLAALAAPAYSADRQERFTIQYVADAQAHRAWWSVLDDGAPVPQGFGAGWKRGKLSFGGERWLAPAPADARAATAPSVRLVSELRHGSERTVTLRLGANGNDSIALIAPEDSNIRSAGVEGFVRPIDPSDRGKYSIGCFGRSCDNLVLEVTMGTTKPIPLIVLGSRAGLPASAEPLLRARPSLARPQYARDESIAFARLKL